MSVRPGDSNRTQSQDSNEATAETMDQSTSALSQTKESASPEAKPGWDVSTLSSASGQQRKQSQAPHLLPSKLIQRSMANSNDREANGMDVESTSSTAANSHQRTESVGASGYGTDGLMKVQQQQQSELAVSHHVQSSETVLGTYRCTIPHEVFDKIKERIHASRERERLSVAKQILRREEECQRQMRDRDMVDLHSKIQVLTEALEIEKGKRNQYHMALKQKRAMEEQLRREISVKERGQLRDMPPDRHYSMPGAAALHHSSAAHANLQAQHQSRYASFSQGSSFPQLPHKRQHSPSPNAAPGGGGHSQSSHRHMSESQSSSSQSKPYRYLGPTNEASAPPAHSPHGGGVKSPANQPGKASGQPSQQAAGSHMLAGMTGGATQMLPYAMPYPVQAAMSNGQMVMVVPNMIGGPVGPNGMPFLPAQFLNQAALLQKPEHLQALTPLQQQALMAQHLQTLNSQNPEYLRAMMESQMMRAGAAAGASAAADSQLQALYRQYAMTAGLAPHMLARPPHMAMMAGASTSPQASGGPSDNSQRTGSILTGVPVYGPPSTHK